MFDIFEFANALRVDRRGVTALEYGLIAGAIAIAIIGAVTGLGTSITNVFTSLASAAW